ncbi:MAG: roadblock/LC7 domain-containing protein [Candidatus Micrarchaeota archaeon]
MFDARGDGMRGRNALVFVLLLGLLLFLSGCAGDTTVSSLPDKERVETTEYADRNLDGYNETTIYYFKPVWFYGGLGYSRVLEITPVQDGNKTRYLLQMNVSLTNSVRNASLLIYDVQMSEKISDQFAAKYSSLKFSRSPQTTETFPIVVWKLQSINCSRTGTLFSVYYNATTDRLPTDVWVSYGIDQPVFNFKVPNPSANPIARFFWDLANGFFLFFARVFGLYAAIAIIPALAYVVFDCARYARRLFNRYKKRTGGEKKEGILLALAIDEIADRRSVQPLHAGAGVLMLIVAWQLISYGSPAEVPESLDNLNPMQDTVKAFGALVLFVGLLFLYTLIPGAVKSWLARIPLFQRRGRAEGKQAAAKGAILLSKDEVIGPIRSLTYQMGELESKISKAKSTLVGVDFSEEEGALGRLRAGLKLANELYEQKRLEDAYARASSVSREFEELSATVDKKLEKEKTLSTKHFNCPSCSADITLSSLLCPGCGTYVPTYIADAIQSLGNDLTEMKKYISELESSVDLTAEKRELNEIITLASRALKLQEGEQYDDATRALEQAKKRRDELKHTISDKAVSSRDLGSRISSLKKLTTSIEELLKKAKGLGVDVGAEGEEYSDISVSDSPEALSLLSRLKKFDEVSNRIESARRRYERLKTMIGDKISAQEQRAGKITVLKRPAQIFRDLVSQTKALGINVSDEEREFQSLNIDDLIAKRTAADDSILESYQKKIEKLNAALSDKIDRFNRIGAKRAGLEKSMLEFKSISEKCASLGIDFFAEQEEFLGIDTARIDKTIETGVDIEGAEEAVARATGVMERVLLSLREKSGIVEQQWAGWSAYIASLLERKERITTDMLADIPEGWRQWVLKHYLAEHTGESLLFEDNALTKLHPPPVSKDDLERVLRTLASSGKIEASAIVRKDGLMIASNLPADIDSNVVAAMSAKLVSNASTTSSELAKGAVKRVIVDGKDGKFIAMSAGRLAILICLIKPSEDMGFVLMSMDAAAKGIIALLEKTSAPQPEPREQPQQQQPPAQSPPPQPPREPKHFSLGDIAKK